MVLVVLFIIFLPNLKVMSALNGLHSDDPSVRKRHHKDLVESPNEPWVDDMILDVIRDPDKAFSIRGRCVGILLERNRLTLVEKAWREGPFDTRTVILSRMSSHPDFIEHFAPDQTFEVRATVEQWLTREGDVTRLGAIQVAKLLDWSDLAPGMRKCLMRSNNPTTNKKDEGLLIIAAASALCHFGDCESIPTIAALVESDPDRLVRLRCMQAIHKTVFGPAPKCAEAITEDAMLALVHGRLDDADNAVRMGAMTILEQTPAWSRRSLDQLQAIVDSDAPETEIRTAVQALIASEDPDVMGDLARYFHHPLSAVRASVVTKLSGVLEPRYEGCFIGVVRDESESRLGFQFALQTLKKRGKEFVGFPEEAKYLGRSNDMPELNKAINQLFDEGELHGVTRDQIADAWFEWWCGELKLNDDAKAKAIAARKAFWAAAAKGQDEAAEQALATLGYDEPDLFSYERGWLHARRTP